MRRLFIVAVALAGAALAGCSSSTNTSSSGSTGGTTTASSTTGNTNSGTTGTSSGTTTGTSSGTTTGNTSSGTTTGNTSSGTTTGSSTGGDLKDVEASHSTTLALKNDGTVWCVGDNSSGLCTTDFNTSPISNWTQVAGVSGSPTQLATGDNFACVLQSGGTVQCWGTNGAGECGTGTIDTTGPIAPTAVTGLANVTQLAGHGTQKFMCALKSDGTVWCWGEDDSGQLGVAPDFTNTAGDGNPYRATAAAVPGISGATSVAVGAYSACAVLSDNSVKCWGGNNNGQLAVAPGSVSQTDCTDPQASQPNPCSVAPLTIAGVTATKVSFATNHACAITTTGDIKCWGFDDGDGELGTTTVSNPGNPTLTPISTAHTFTNAKDIACYGDTFDGVGGCVAVNGDDTVWAWGDNQYGQLDQDPLTFVNTVTDANGNSPGPGPVQVTPLGSGHITHLSVTLQAVVTYDNGAAWGWGYDNEGQLGDQGGGTNFPPAQLTGI